MNRIIPLFILGVMFYIKCMHFKNLQIKAIIWKLMKNKSTAQLQK